MKRFLCVLIVASLITIVLPIGLVFAQKSLPQVPITYAGDTDKTIIRRAQWIENARREGNLVRWGSDEPAAMKQIAAEFNKIYPFIKVDYWRGQGTEITARLETEHAVNRVSVDICDAEDIHSYPRWRKIGLVDKLIDFMPGIEKKDKRTYSKDGDWAVLGDNPFAPSYNIKLVSAAEAPKHWEDLLHPRFKGKIGMSADTKPWYTLALAEGGWGIEKTEDFLRKLKQQEPIWARGYGAARTLMIAEEFKIMAADNLKNIILGQKKSPLEWCRLSPIPIDGKAIFLAKKAPHPNAARLFIEWVFSPQGLATLERVAGRSSASPGSGTRLSKALEGLPLVYRTEEVVMKVAELGLVDRFSKILGIVAE